MAVYLEDFNDEKAAYKSIGDSYESKAVSTFGPRGLAKVYFYDVKYAGVTKRVKICFGTISSLTEDIAALLKSEYQNG